jgi:FkbM family methyltransferase
MFARRAIRVMLGKLGYAVSRTEGGMGGDPFADMHALIRRDQPLILDVGANIGQSIEAFRSWFPNAYIHSFEPSPEIFARLKTKVANLPNVSCWNIALGSEPADLPLNENRMPEWSSLLPIDRAWGKVEKQTMVPVRTVDEFCDEHGIKQIDALKSDTQGFEIEVLRGAQRMLQEGRVGFVFCEVLFTPLYTGVPPFTRICDFLMERGFSLVSFYSFSYTRTGIADWADVLFIHNSRVAHGARGAIDMQSQLQSHGEIVPK